MEERGRVADGAARGGGPLPLHGGARGAGLREPELRLRVPAARDGVGVGAEAPPFSPRTPSPDAAQSTGEILVFSPGKILAFLLNNGLIGTLIAEKLNFCRYVSIGI